MSEPVQVLIVDDQPRARQSLKALLATWPLIGAVREATNGEEAIGSVEQARPDIVLMDVHMPVMNGLEATRRIKEHWPQVRIIALSIYGDYQADALVAGADAFISKGESPEKLLDTVAAVVNATALNK
jgi:DNA-binding NarL/FixJ family response regulator